MKKFFTTIILICINFTFNVMPCIAAEQASSVIIRRSGTTETVEADSIVKLQFVNDFNINRVSNGDTVLFNLAESINDADNTVIPQGTRFVGTIKNQHDSRWAFRRASADIVLNKLIMPDGRTYYIHCQPKSGTLKSPAALNAALGLTTAAVSAGVCIFSAALIAIETLSVGGLIFAPVTGAAVGVAFSAVSKGLNYKASAGSSILFKLDSPIVIDLYDYSPDSPSQYELRPN